METRTRVEGAQAQAQAILNDLAGAVDQQLRTAGLSSRERRAEWGLVPPTMRAKLPLTRLEAWVKGIGKPLGFGLGAETGTGKTMAVAAMLNVAFRRKLRGFAEGLEERARAAHGDVAFVFGHGVRWASWPDLVNWIRGNGTDPAVAELLQDLCRAELLVLDDLGRERIKGSYVEDWAASQLDGLISYRYREELPIIWTSNLDAAGLAGIYGGALVSRLLEDAPQVWIDGLPSMRLK